MQTTDMLRNALVASGCFDRVQYCGKNQIYLEKDCRYYIIRENAVDDITGLSALFAW